MINRQKGESNKSQSKRNPQEKGRKSANHQYLTRSSGRIQACSAQTNQQLSKYIISVLAVVNRENNPEKYYASSFKSNSKTLLNTIGTLLNSIDGSFEVGSIQIDHLIDIFKFMGYPQTINKNIFNPVGAPHTWTACLQLMQWMAELATANYQLQCYDKQKNRQTDITKMEFNKVCLMAALKDEQQIIQQYLLNNLEDKKKRLQQLDFDIQNYKMSIENVKKKQKDLSEVDQDRNSLEKKLFRVREEVIATDRVNDNIRENTKEVQTKMDSVSRQIQHLNKNLKRTQEQIDSQELNAQQYQQVQNQVRQLNVTYQGLERQIKKLMNNNQSKFYELSIQYEKFRQNLIKLGSLWEKMPQMHSFLHLITVRTPIFDLQKFKSLLQCMDQSSIDDFRRFLQNFQSNSYQFTNRVNLILKVFREKLDEQTKILQKQKNREHSCQNTIQVQQIKEKQMNIEVQARIKLMTQIIDQCQAIRGEIAEKQQIRTNLRELTEEISSSNQKTSQNILELKNRGVRHKENIRKFTKQTKQILDIQRKQLTQQQMRYSYILQKQRETFTKVNPQLEAILSERKQASHSFASKGFLSH